MLTQYTVTSYYNDFRIDKYLSEMTVGFSREKLKETFHLNKVFINSVVVKPSKKIKTDDIVSIELPEVKTIQVVAQNIPIDIIYEDNDIVIVNKPQGMVVHPASGNYEKTLVNALLYHIKDLSTINGVIRPGIVHRIDKDTSGLLVIAKNNEAHLKLTQQFSVHSITREYCAYVNGVITSNTGKIDAPIGRNPSNRLLMAVTPLNSKHAVTYFETIKNYSDYSFINVKLETGRTHQIRVHMKYISHPVIGDKIYANNSIYDKMFPGQLLHAHKLGFIHPTTHKYIEFSCDVPDYFHKLESNSIIQS